MSPTVGKRSGAQQLPRPGTGGWGLLRAMLREQRAGLTAGVVVGLLWSAGKVAVPKLTSLAVDRAVLGNGSLLFWSLLIGAVAVIAGVFTAWRRWFAFRESRLTETKLREQLFAHIMRLHVAYHDHTQTGQLMSRASSDLLQIQGFVVMIPITASNLAMVLSIVVVLVIQQPLLAVIALAPLPFLNVLATRFSRRIHPAVLAVQAEQAQLATVVEEAVSGVRVIKGFGAEDVTAARLRTEADDIRTVSLEAARVRSAFLPALDLLPNLGLIAVLAIGGHRVLDGEMSRGQMLEFMQYIGLLIFPLRNLGMTVAFGQRAAAALLRVNEVLSTVPAVADAVSPQTLPVSTAGAAGVGAVSFRHVQFGYSSDAPTLKDFDLEIPAGASVAIVGATGSGKSTVARLLLRFFDPSEGSITLGGADLRANRGGDGGYGIGGNSRVAFGSSYNDAVASSGAGGTTSTNGNFVNLPASLSNVRSVGSFALSIFNSAANRFLTLELSAMEADGKGKIVSSPRIITADQTKALIEQGTEYPYSVTAPNGATTLAFKKAVLKLEVTPQITPEGNIILDLDINKDSRGETTTQGVAIDTKHIKTQILIENGGTVVIGGIFEMEETNQENKIPVLGDVPVVGNLFKSRTKESTKREMLVFITPKVISDRGPTR